MAVLKKTFGIGLCLVFLSYSLMKIFVIILCTFYFNIKTKKCTLCKLIHRIMCWQPATFISSIRTYKQPVTALNRILRIYSKYKKIRTRNNFVFRHFSRSLHLVKIQLRICSGSGTEEY